MHLIYCDETNFKKNSNDFFLYGGIVIKDSNAQGLSNEIEQLRKDFSVPKEYVLKFNPGPENLDHKTFIELKKNIISLAVKYECKLLINLLLHDIAKSSEEARRYAVNTLCYHFNCYLSRPNDYGLVLIDRFFDKEIDLLLKQKLHTGISGQLPFGESMRLDRILGYHFTAIGQSHFCSLVDIVIGSLRFSLNTFTQGGQTNNLSANAILGQISPLFFRQSSNKVHPISIWFSPKDVKHEVYRARYAELAQFLMKNGIETQQKYRPTIFG